MAKLACKPTAEVCILEGEFAGKKVWVWDDWLRCRVQAATNGAEGREVTVFGKQYWD